MINPRQSVPPLAMKKGALCCTGSRTGPGPRLHQRSQAKEPDSKASHSGQLHCFPLVGTFVVMLANETPKVHQLPPRGLSGVK